MDSFAGTDDFKMVALRWRCICEPPRSGQRYTHGTAIRETSGNGIVCNLKVDDSWFTTRHNVHPRLPKKHVRKNNQMKWNDRAVGAPQATLSNTKFSYRPIIVRRFNEFLIHPIVGKISHLLMNNRNVIAAY